MAISLESLQRGKIIVPPRIILYSVNGLGKSTFGANSIKPVFICTEEGRGILEFDGFPVAKSYDEVNQALDVLIKEKHEYKTIVIDTIDWLEKLIFAQVCEDKGKQSIEDIGYAKGYTFALTYWQEILTKLEQLRHEKKMIVLCLGHVLVKSFNAPDTENYDRYRFDLNDKGASLLQDWADIILFGNYKIYLKETDKGFGQKEHKAVGGTERVIYSEERPTHWAKNRYGLPYEMPLDWNVFWTEFQKATGLK